MSNDPVAATGQSSSPAVLFFGMRCAFSVPPLATLIAAGVDVRAVVLPRQSGATSGHAIDRLATDVGIPVVEVPSPRRPEVVHMLSPYRPEMLVVACFPWRLPPPILALVPWGGLNLHPSLLPGLRGPEPVFWTLRRGERQTGVTIHRLDDGLDTGPVVARRAVDVPAGVRAPDLERHLAELGGELLVPALRAVAAGTVPGMPQEDALATHAPVPTEADWLVPTNLPAEWAYAFVRGVAPLGGPLTLLVLGTGERIPLVDAIAVDSRGTLDAPVIRSGDELTARFRPGTVTFLVQP